MCCPSALATNVTSYVMGDSLGAGEYSPTHGWAVGRGLQVNPELIFT